LVKIKKDFKKSIFFLVLFILLLLVTASLASISNKKDNINSEELITATITELTVSNSNTKLLAYFTLKINNPDELKQILISGVPIKFTYYIRLYIPNVNILSFLNRDISDIILIKTVSYDSIKGTYQIHIIDTNSRIIYTNSFNDVLTNICQINDLPVTSLTNLVKGKIHILKVKVEAKKVLSSIPFKDILTIFSSDIFQTNWYEIKFTY